VPEAEGVYRFIALAEDRGVTAGDLLAYQQQEGIGEEALEAALCHIKNFGRVVEVVAHNDQRLVADTFAARWSWRPVACSPKNKTVTTDTASAVGAMPEVHEETNQRDKGKKKPGEEPESHELALIRPWKTLTGSIDQQFILELRRHVFEIILYRPGLYQETIMEELQLLGRELVRVVLNSLLMDELIYVRKITVARPSLFSSLVDPIVLPGPVSLEIETSSPLPFVPGEGRDGFLCYFARSSALAHL